MSLEQFFNPRSVAVVGASREKGKVGYEILTSMVRGGYQGAIYPVNAKATEVEGLRCYPSLAAIPEPIDLAVILVPRDAVAGVIDECIALGVRGIVVITAGFSETGAEGRALEEELSARVRAAGGRRSLVHRVRFAHVPIGTRQRAADPRRSTPDPGLFPKNHLNPVKPSILVRGHNAPL